LARDGRLVASYPSQTAPDDAKLVRELEKQLGVK
ncbi:MAG: hypothetical protein JWQ88_1726, partial [Rhodoferax sp.]|nr:hypothetical protein [Rhodoferax sp.]